MDMLERIKELQKEKKLSNYQLAAEAEVPQSTINNMYTRGTLPTMSTFFAICKALNMTPSQFFNESETTLILSEEETELVEAYRQLTKKNRNAIIKLINELK